VAVIGLHKAREVIRLDDSEDSPEYILDLTDGSLEKKGDLLSGCVNDFYDIQEKINDESCDQREVMARLSKVYASVISAFLGRRAYNEIVAYVTDGDKSIRRSELNVLLSPVVLFLIGRYADVVRHREFEKASRKYLDEEPAAL